MVYLLLASLLFTQPVLADVGRTEEIRCCITPIRDRQNQIVRNESVKRAFRKLYPCPVEVELNKPCPGWAIDHVIPLVCGGLDIVSNMQWLPNEIKSGPEPTDKDRYEQRVYCK